METGAINTQSVDKSMSTMQQEVETATEVSARGLERSARAVSPITTEYEFTSDNIDDSDDDDKSSVLQMKKDSEIKIIEVDEKKLKERETRMKHMRSIFGTQPELERIAKGWANAFVDSNFTEYHFTHLCDTNPDDLRYMINLCRSNLTKLSISNFMDCPSSMMPLINSNCPNLQVLELTFYEVEDKDFDNCFSNMPHLESLEIRLKFVTSTVPMTLAKSLEQVCETLKIFLIESEENQLYSPDSSVPVFSPSTKILMSTILKMKNIEKLFVRLDHGITDEFLKNLINNAKKINTLFLRGSYITDAGIKVLNNAEQLRYFGLHLFTKESANKFITDQSLECLSNEKIIYLDLSNCVNVTNRGVITLVKNLPNILHLFVNYSKVTDEVQKEIDELKKCGKTNLSLFTCHGDEL
ncbi:uncharacterized protein LOC122853976 [Aphidius gifuensis]|uniref:uncharacterized protein LOC122853976 n=1 Tax=Aphidius gifuensis TaxID=684658 RepID=UPI001CDC9359|nr:uncharacterized protein LOC122853976 [Aphidius gifuensis]